MTDSDSGGGISFQIVLRSLGKFQYQSDISYLMVHLSGIVKSIYRCQTCYVTKIMDDPLFGSDVLYVKAA